MEGKKYVAKRYPSSTRILAQQGSNHQLPQNPVNQHKVRAPAVGYTNNFGSPTKFELLNEYVYGPDMSRSSNYAPTGYYEVNNKPNYGISYGNSNKSIITSPVHGYSSEESIYGPGLAGARHVRTKEFVPNQTLISARPRGTQSKALGYIEESDNHLQPLDTKQRGVLSSLATRERSLETRRTQSKALGYIEESDNHLQPLDTKQRLVLSSLATRE